MTVRAGWKNRRDENAGPMQNPSIDAKGSLNVVTVSQEFYLSISVVRNAESDPVTPSTQMTCAVGAHRVGRSGAGSNTLILLP